MSAGAAAAGTEGTQRSPVHPIVLAGLIAGTLDITAAVVQTLIAGRKPERMLQGIASGWLGKASYTYGPASMALGLASHFFIATTWAALYWLASRRSAPLIRHAWVYGTAYGIVVYGVMYEIVMPLSAIHRRIPRTPQDYIIGLLVHIVCVGLPIALVVRATTPRRDLTAN